MDPWETYEIKQAQGNESVPWEMAAETKRKDPSADTFCRNGQDLGLVNCQGQKEK